MYEDKDIIPKSDQSNNLDPPSRRNIYKKIIIPIDANKEGEKTDKKPVPFKANKSDSLITRIIQQIDNTSHSGSIPLIALHEPKEGGVIGLSDEEARRMIWKMLAEDDSKEKEDAREYVENYINVMRENKTDPLGLGKVGIELIDQKIINGKIILDKASFIEWHAALKKAVDKNLLKQFFTK